MPISWGELDATARFAFSVVAIIALASPFLSQIKAIRQIHFGNPWAFDLPALVITITSFLAPHYYRNWLHFLPAWWWWFLGAVVIFLILVLFAVHYQARAIPKSVLLLAISGYAIMAGSLTLGFTHLSSTAVVYSMLHGIVLRSGGTEPARLVPVYVLGARPGQLLQSKTNRSGVFQFLLTKKEAQDTFEIRAKENQQLGRNWAVIDWDGEGPYYCELSVPE